MRELINIHCFAGKSIELDCKDCTSRYANDVIASCVFGIKINSCVDVHNKFYKMGKTLASFNLNQMLVFFYLGVFPTLAKVTINTT